LKVLAVHRLELEHFPSMGLLDQAETFWSEILIAGIKVTPLKFLFCVHKIILKQLSDLLLSFSLLQKQMCYTWNRQQELDSRTLLTILSMIR
jgi:hypothetical protein